MKITKTKNIWREIETELNTKSDWDWIQTKRWKCKVIQCCLGKNEYKNRSSNLKKTRQFSNKICDASSWPFLYDIVTNDLSQSNNIQNVSVSSQVKKECIVKSEMSRM